LKERLPDFGGLISFYAKVVKTQRLPEIMVATRIPKAIIKDKASYVLMYCHLPALGGTNHQKSLFLQ
jgi:hypothetical protein